MKNRRCAYALMLCATLWSAISFPAGAQKKHGTAVATKPAASEVVATVNGEKILWSSIVDDLIDDQLARLNVTMDQFKDNQRLVASAAGALLLRKLSNSGGQSVTVTRDEIKSFLLKDKSRAALQAVDFAIQGRAVRQAAKIQQVTVTDAEIKAKMVESINKVRASAQQSGAQLAGLSDQQLLKTIGFREAFLRRNVAVFLMLEKLVAKEFQNRVGHAVGSGDFIDASHILISVKPQNEAEKEKAFDDGLKKIKDIADQIKSGKTTFEEAASRNNEDQTKFKKGELGLFMRGQMLPEFDKAVFSLEPGKVSEPVRTQYGWHLIKVNRLGKDATPQERNQALQAVYSTNTQAYVQKLMQQAKIDNKLSPPGAQQGLGMRMPQQGR